MGWVYCQLGMAERRELFRMVDAGLAVVTMAARLGRHRSTIYRELRRNRVEEEHIDRRHRPREGTRFPGYFPVTADGLARQRRQRGRKLLRSPLLVRHVVGKLRFGWSPQQIAGRMALAGGERVSHETIYQYVYGPEGRATALHLCLAQRRRLRRRKSGRRPRKSPIPVERSIAYRPEDVAARKVFGHWESDLLMFAKDLGKGNVTTLLERKARYVVLLPNRDRRSAAVIGGIASIFGALPAPARQTITFDRGKEFAAYPALAQELAVTSYFCDPHSPWQKGAVENGNGRLRRFLPPETDPASLSAVYLQHLADRLNETPRRCLAYRTPQEVFLEHVTALPGPGYNDRAVSHFA
jgi:transposase, IS30 family